MTTRPVRLASLFGTGMALAAALVLSGCNKEKDAAASATDSAAPTAAADTVAPTDSASSSTAANPQGGDDQAETERLHRQEMDHEDMRMGRMAPQPSASPDSQQGGNQPMPMKDM